MSSTGTPPNKRRNDKHNGPLLQLTFDFFQGTLVNAANNEEQDLSQYGDSKLPCDENNAQRERGDKRTRIITPQEEQKGG